MKSCVSRATGSRDQPLDALGTRMIEHKHEAFLSYRRKPEVYVSYDRSVYQIHKLIVSNREKTGKDI